MFRFIGILALALLAGAVGGLASGVGEKCFSVGIGWECIQQQFFGGATEAPITPPLPWPVPDTNCVTLDDAKSIHSLAEIIGVGRIGDLNNFEEVFSGNNVSGCVDLDTVLKSSCELLSGGAAGNCSQI